MPHPSSSRRKVREHRGRLREQGLRPVQIWVPDTRSRRFAAEDQAFVDSVSASLPG